MRAHTVEDYLLAIYRIYEIQGFNGPIKSVDIAKSLKISKPSVSAILRKLSSKGYLKLKRYSPIQLTEKGIREGKRVTHNHRLIEYFLKESLKIDVKKIHEEAHALEHSFSQNTIKKLDNFLGNPKISPTGKRIH